MKKYAAAAAVMAAMIAFAGCGKGSDDAATFTAKPAAHTEAAESAVDESIPDDEEMKRAFKKPADLEKVDTSLEDPSTAAMKFIFDDDSKRITGVFYSFGDYVVSVTYSYSDDNKVRIIAGMQFGSKFITADDAEFTLPAYDESVGIAEHEGYYFKGYKFE